MFFLGTVVSFSCKQSIFVGFLGQFGNCVSEMKMFDLPKFEEYGIVIT